MNKIGLLKEKQQMNTNKYKPLIIRGIIGIVLFSAFYVIYNRVEPIGYNRLYYRSNYDNFSRILNYSIYSYALTNYQKPSEIEDFIEYIEYQNSTEHCNKNDNNSTFFTITIEDVLKYLKKNKKRLKFKYIPTEEKDTIIYLLYNNNFVAFGYYSHPTLDSPNSLFSQVAFYSSSFKDTNDKNCYSSELQSILNVRIKQINQKFLDSLSINHKAEISSYMNPIVYCYNKDVLSNYLTGENIDKSDIYFKNIYALLDSISKTNNLSKIICTNYYVNLESKIDD